MNNVPTKRTFKFYLQAFIGGVIFFGLLVLGIIVFAYVFLAAVVLAAVFFIIGFIVNLFNRRKHVKTVPYGVNPQNKPPSEGRVFDHNDTV